MKRALVLSALLLAGAVPALAADLPPRAPPPIPIPIATWTGFYIGINGGYSWGESSRTLSFINTTGVPIVPPAGSITTGGSDLEGGVFGGQVGYNWQMTNWVLGFETDFQWSGQRGSANFLCAATAVGGACLPGLTFLPPGVAGTAATVDQELEWFGTFRGRVGFLIVPSTLLYATGGLAYGSLKTDATIASFTPGGLPIAASFSNSNTRVGWTVGGGLEMKFAPNWSGKLEYLYMDIGTTDATWVLTTAAGTGIGVNVSSRVTDHIFRAGINYQFSTW